MQYVPWMIWMIQRTAVPSGRNMEDMEDSETPVTSCRNMEDMEEWKVLVLKRPVERRERIFHAIDPVEDLEDSGTAVTSCLEKEGL